MVNDTVHTFESVWATIESVGKKLDRVAAMQAETAEQMKATDRKIEKVNKMVGGISNNHGSFAEEYFANSLQKGKNNFFGERFDRLLKYQLIEDKNKTRAECDIMLVNGKSVAIIEVKFKVREKDVEKVEKKVKYFREKFPEYQNHSVYLGLASMVFDENVELNCIKNGIAVIKQAGDTVIVIDENIKAY
jgi:hypothetical protein